MPESPQAQFKTEGQPAFPVEDTGNENPADSPTDQTTDEQTQTPEGDENSDDNTKPVIEEDTDTDNPDDDDTDDKGDNDQTTDLSKHPRWQERENDWKERFNTQEERHAKEINELRQEIQKMNSQNQGDEGELSEDIPSWFGGDEKQWKEFKQWNDSQFQKVQEKAVKTIDEKTEAEKKAVEDATNYMNSEVDAIQNDKTLNPQGVKVDKNKLLKTVLDNELVDTKGRWNYRAGWRLMQSQAQSKNANTINNKKKIAGATTNDNKSEPTRPDFMTTEDFRNPSNRPW